MDEFRSGDSRRPELRRGDPGGDEFRKPRWWAWVAGLLAVLFMLYETGSWVLTVLCFAALAGLVIYQLSRREKSGTASRYCLKCGEELNPNANECRACGSASWSFKN